MSISEEYAGEQAEQAELVDSSEHLTRTSDDYYYAALFEFRVITVKNGELIPGALRELVGRIDSDTNYLADCVIRINDNTWGDVSTSTNSDDDVFPPDPNIRSSSMFDLVVSQAADWLYDIGSEYW